MISIMGDNEQPNPLKQNHHTQPTILIVGNNCRTQLTQPTILIVGNNCRAHHTQPTILIVGDSAEHNTHCPRLHSWATISNILRMNRAHKLSRIIVRDCKISCINKIVTGKICADISRSKVGCIIVNCTQIRSINRTVLIHIS